MKPVLIKGLVSDQEICELKAFSGSNASKEHLKHSNAASWRTRYLHAGGAMRAELPALQSKLIEAALKADSENWQLIKTEARSHLKVRCVEHHLVGPGGALPDPTHFDGGSVLTLDVMLASPGDDFTGGEFCTPEADGSVECHGSGRFDKGDALVFVSHKPHYVRPVTEGLRETMILELWEGEERKCDHRCATPFGRCNVEDGLPTDGGAGGVGTDSQQHALDITARDASSAFASTAFEGNAFYARVAQIQAHSQAVALTAKAASVLRPNVAVTFEDVTPVATVRALQRIALGERLLVKMTESDDEMTDEESEEEPA